MNVLNCRKLMRPCPVFWNYEKKKKNIDNDDEEEEIKHENRKCFEFVLFLTLE